MTKTKQKTKHNETKTNKEVKKDLKLIRTLHELSKGKKTSPYKVYMKYPH